MLDTLTTRKILDNYRKFSCYQLFVPAVYLALLAVLKITGGFAAVDNSSEKAAYEIIAGGVFPAIYFPDGFPAAYAVGYH